MNDIYNENDFKGNIEGIFIARFSGMELYLGEWGECYRFTFRNEDRTLVEHTSQTTPSKRNKFGRLLKYLSGQEFNENYSPCPSHYIGNEYFLLCDRNNAGTIAITCFAPIPARAKMKKPLKPCILGVEFDVEKMKSEMLCDNGLSVEEDARLSDEWEQKQKKQKVLL